MTAEGLTADTTYVMRLTAKADVGGGWGMWGGAGEGDVGDGSCGGGSFHGLRPRRRWGGMEMGTLWTRVCGEDVG
ncbi:MAG: hypothetical protein IPN19_02420 [Elusimicrobia bacterium]|nr:hypothetical protein [Elusimicrobiota bacterium]